MKRISQDNRYLILILLFSASGFCALVYEVVWYQLLQLVIGSTSVSLGILLATFMGGLCVGSFWLSRDRRLRKNPLRGYAFLELAIGVCAIGVQFGLPYLDHVYVAGAQHGLPSMLLRGLLAAICMAPPTVLMGASLPTILRGVERTPEDAAYFYGANTAGAVAGCMITGFFLLRLFDMRTAIFCAAAINAIVAAASLLLACEARVDYEAVAEKNSPESSVAACTTFNAAEPRWQVYVVIALSGAIALGAEVIWTRLLSILLLGTVYVFSIILAVFLSGLAIGSGAAAWVLSKMRPRVALGWSQLCVALGIAWTAYAIVHVLPGWRDDVLTTQNAWRIYELDLKRCALAILPATLLWGASFPFACAAVERPGEDAGKAAGEIYAANTVGAILGALMVSLVLIPWIGSQETQRLLIVLAAIGPLFLLGRRLLTIKGGLIAAAAGVVALLLVRTVSPVPGELIAYGRMMGSYAGSSKILATAEGRNSSVAISQWNDGTIFVNVNGHVEATTEIYDMRLQRMVGHLPALLHPDPKSVLGIGFGAGVSAGTFTLYPSVRDITVCEIEPHIPPMSTRYFGDEDYHVALDPRTHIVFDDARHYLMTTQRKFDIIASDPLDVFLKGTAALYSKEYFEAVKAHLNPGGIFTLYVPLYETDEPTIRSELATFFEVFPYGTIWSNTRDGAGYDTIFMGQLTPLKINMEDVIKRADRPDYSRVRQSLNEVGIQSPYDLFSTYTGDAEDFAPWLRGAQINTDDNLRLSYLAGWGINSDLADSLYQEMLRRRTTPVDIFSGSPDTIAALFSEMQVRLPQRLKAK